MVECRGCRALEFISNGIRKGTIMDIRLSDPIYSCCFGNKIVLVDNKPCCENCTEKTTSVKKEKEQ